MSGSTISVHVWDRSFLLRAGSFTLSKHSKPYRRPSATVLVARDAPFVLKTNHGPRRQYQAALVAPFVLRQSLVAEGSGLAIVDAGITSEAYRRLRPRLAPQQVAELGGDELERLRACIAATVDDADCGQARQLFDGIVAALAPAAVPELEPQMAQFLALMEQADPAAPAEEQLARILSVPPRRLRKQFGDAIGCSPEQFQQWLSAWRVMRAWQPGVRLPQLAEKAGLTDLAALEGTVQQLFGLGAAGLFGSARLRFHNCTRC